MNTYLAQDTKVVNLLPPKDLSTSAHAVAYVNGGKYPHVDFVITMGATGAIGSSVAVSLKQAINVSGSSNAALAMGHYYTNAAAVASASIDNDTFTRVSVASSAATFNLTPSTNNITYIIPVDSSKMADGKPYVGVGVAATGAATICGCTAVLSESRYKGTNTPTAL